MEQDGIIGILPEWFPLLGGRRQLLAAAAIDPARSTRSQTYLFDDVGRLADGATIQPVDQQMNQVAADLENNIRTATPVIAWR